jgi:hypothetical protein
MILKVASGLGLVVLSASLHAEGNLEGSYNGTFNLQTQSRGVVPIAMTLVITTAKDGRLQGKASRSHYGKAGQGCMGEYKLEGTYQGNMIEMKSAPGGPAGDCALELHLVAEGNRLKGTMGKSEVDFSK